MALAVTKFLSIGSTGQFFLQLEPKYSNSFFINFRVLEPKNTLKLGTRTKFTPVSSTCCPQCVLLRKSDVYKLSATGMDFCISQHISMGVVDGKAGKAAALPKY